MGWVRSCEIPPERDGDFRIFGRVRNSSFAFLRCEEVGLAVHAKRELGGPGERELSTVHVFPFG
jgi:hypothetical protein